MLIDACAFGFGWWARKRLRLLGYEVEFADNHIHWDWYLKKIARQKGYIIVTFDRDFQGEPNAIVLDHQKKYEENLTLLLKELRRKGWGTCENRRASPSG